MMEIPLTKGYVALVDDECFDYLSQWKWHAEVDRDGSAYARRRLRSGAIQMHRLIVKAPEGMDIDHANGNTLDNRKANLRICTRAQNVANAHVDKPHTSRYRGVHWNPEKGKWRAQVGGSKHEHIGYFETEEEAAHARDRRVREKYGEFAKLNFPGAQ